MFPNFIFCFQKPRLEEMLKRAHPRSQKTDRQQMRSSLFIVGIAMKRFTVEATHILARVSTFSNLTTRIRYGDLKPSTTEFITLDKNSTEI